MTRYSGTDSAEYYAFCADMMAGIEEAGRRFKTHSTQVRTFNTLYGAGFRAYKDVVDAGPIKLAAIKDPPSVAALAVIFGEQEVAPVDKGAFMCSRCGKPTAKDGSYVVERWVKSRNERGSLETKRLHKDWLCPSCGRKVFRAIKESMVVEEEQR